MTDDAPSPTYPMARLVARHADRLAIVVGLALAGMGILALLDGAPWWAGIALVGGGALAYVLLRSYGELVRILLDILLPQ